MSFDDFHKKEGNATFKKTEFFNGSEGTHVVRLIDQPEKFHQHWIKGGPGIKCLGSDCPQCEINSQILTESNNDFKVASKVNGYVYRQARGAINVLDRTEAKVCPNCGTDNKKIKARYQAVCRSCGQSIIEVEAKPLNQVKLLSRSAKLFEDIIEYNGVFLDESGDPIPLNSMDLKLSIAGNATIPEFPDEPVTDEVEYSEDSLFDLSKAVVSLTREEMIERMRGIQLRDIFSARKIEEQVEEDTPEEVTSEVVEDINSRIAELFN